MSLYSLNKDMLVKLVCTIENETKKRYEGYHEIVEENTKKIVEFDLILEKNLQNCHYFVEADNFAMHALWVMYVDRPYKGCKKSRLGRNSYWIS